MRAQRLFLCLERVFTPPSLLIAFVSSLYAFATLLTLFILLFSQFSHLYARSPGPNKQSVGRGLAFGQRSPFSSLLVARKKYNSRQARSQVWNGGSLLTPIKKSAKRRSSSAVPLRQQLYLDAQRQEHQILDA